MQEGRLSAVEVVHELIEAARQRRASDIHITPLAGALRVVLRIDGALTELDRLPKYLQPELIARIKVLSGMRTDEHQAPQDGRFRHTEGVVVRVSIAPTYYGENAVLRLLRQDTSPQTLSDLGFSELCEREIMHTLERPSGMLLVSGPTGSGKTTTLYTLLMALRAQKRAIITIEDPIEYAVDEITQIQVNPRAGLSFASGLRAIVRQDPNSIMVGEIRDHETATLAVHTALTGHLLLSTVHTTSAAGVVPRLLEMGIDAYLIASTLSLVIGQRLVRVLCPVCKVATPLSSTAYKNFEGLPLHKKLIEGELFWSAPGCEACADSGFQGRTILGETLRISDPMREKIMRKAPARELHQTALELGMVPILDQGFYKARLGITSIAEVMRVAYE